MSLKFGTDGVRGVANAALTPSYVLNLGRAAARVLGADRVVIGRDTRRSGAMLESALAAGFASEGVDVELLGVVPTPAVAYIAKVDSVAAAVITASHNPFADNGVKLFAAGGVKLTDEIERGIEAELAALDEPVLTGGAVGTISHLSDGLPRYVDHLVGLLPAAAFSGMSLVLDCAHGAMSPVAPDVLRRLGADVHLIGVEPDGCNINDGFGATHPGPLAAEVVARRAQLGLAFDGDGDRLPGCESHEDAGSNPVGVSIFRDFFLIVSCSYCFTYNILFNFNVNIIFDNIMELLRNLQHVRKRIKFLPILYYVI